MIRLLTVRQVADHLALHPQTVRKLIARGAIPSSRIGRAIRVEEGDLAAFIRAGGSARREQTVALEQITPGQLRAFHAKADRTDRITGQPRLSAKRQVLAEASAHYKATLTSANDLDEMQANWCMDRLDEIADLELRG